VSCANEYEDEYENILRLAVKRGRVGAGLWERARGRDDIAHRLAKTPIESSTDAGAHPHLCRPNRFGVLRTKLFDID